MIALLAAACTAGSTGATDAPPVDTTTSPTTPTGATGETGETGATGCDCDDGLDCTDDTCDADGACLHAVVTDCAWPAANVTFLTAIDGDFQRGQSGATFDPATGGLWIVGGGFGRS
ncbi:MAG: hypothetical protein ABMB14_40540, partial [Myxococcota bacterium]